MRGRRPAASHWWGTSNCTAGGARTAPRRPAATVVTVTSGGERSFLHLMGANGRLVAQDVPDELLARSRVLHLGGFFILPALDGPPAAGVVRGGAGGGGRGG